MKVFVFAMLFAVALGAGCRNSVNSVRNAESSATVYTTADKRLVTDAGLRDGLKISPVNIATTGDNLLRVQFTAANTRVGFFDKLFGAGSLKFRYRFTWLDKDAMAIESVGSTWKEIELLPGEATQVQSVAPSAQCKDFVVQLIEAK